MYLLDANVLSRAKNEYYGFDFCPAFWNWIEMARRAGTVGSVGRVDDELSDWSDSEVSAWLADHASGFFLPHDDAAKESLRRVEAWAEDEAKIRSSSPRELRRFRDRADAPLVAHAAAEGHVVVTLEKAVRSDSSKLKIPNACEAFGVECITPYEMLRREDVVFLLGGRWGDADGNVVLDGPPLAYGTYGPWSTIEAPVPFAI